MIPRPTHTADRAPEDQAASTAERCDCLVLDPCGCLADPCACFRTDERGCCTDCGCPDRASVDLQTLL